VFLYGNQKKLLPRLYRCYYRGNLLQLLVQAKKEETEASSFLQLNIINGLMYKNR